MLTVILPARLREIAHEIIREVFIAVKGEALFNQFQAEPGLSIQSVYPEELDAVGWAVPPKA
jgi:hypothetical protein